MHKGLGTYAAGVVAILVAATLAVPAFAGNKAGGGTSSSIKIASVDGAATPLSPTTKLGDTLTFTTSIQSLAGWEYPMVAVSCYQDVNGDGVVDTRITGPDLVYSGLDKPSATFTLGGFSSIWTQRGGGPAVCRADLDAYGWKAGQESTSVLATTGTWSS